MLRRAAADSAKIVLRVASALLAVACLALAIAPVAAARPGYVTHPADDSLFMVGDGSNGYTVGVFGDSPGRATVLVESLASRSVTYELPALITKDRLVAHYGDVIDVSIRFHPNPGQGYKGGITHGRCIGRKPDVRRGKFVGTIEFHGELGYTELVRTRLSGTSAHEFKRICKKGSPRPAAAASSVGPPAEQLVVARVEGGAETWFRALTGIAHPKNYPQWIFEAKRDERIGRVKILRRILVEGEAGATLSPPGVVPITAAVAPPFPFVGSAEFQRGADGVVSWTGSLGAELPGLGTFPLTGGGFTALTCVGEGAAEHSCAALSPLAPPYP